MDCVAECEYCKSINIPVDGPNCSITGYYCKELYKLVQINKPVDIDCPFVTRVFSYKDIYDFKVSVLYKLHEKMGSIIDGMGYVSFTDIKSVLDTEFSKLLD